MLASPNATVRTVDVLLAGLPVSLNVDNDLEKGNQERPWDRPLNPVGRDSDTQRDHKHVYLTV